MHLRIYAFKHLRIPAFNNSITSKTKTMTFIEKLYLIERIDQLIRLKATGSTQDLAIRLNLSRSTTYEIIEVMKSMGADIIYCKDRKSYCYTKEFELAIGFVEKKSIKGGKKLYFFTMSDFFGQTHHKFAPETFQKGDSEPSHSL